MVRISPAAALAVASLLAAAGCAARRTPPPVPRAPDDLSFRGRRFESAPDPWMRRLPGAASLREAGLVSFESPLDDAAVGDIEMDAVRYDYWNGSLYEIEVSKRNLPTEGDAVRLADKLHRALSVWSQARPGDWTKSEARRQEKAGDGAGSADVFEEALALSAGGTEVRIDVEGRRTGTLGSYDVNVRFLDRDRVRELVSRLTPTR